MNSNLEIIDHASFINNYLIKLFVDTVTGCAHKSIIAINNSSLSATRPAITMQFYYNNDTNKCFIEVALNSNFKNQYADSLLAIKTIFTKWLNKNLKQDTTVWPELVFPEDGKHEICDSSRLLTPFTIGYWKSLSGNYQFIEDEVKILKDYNDMVFPKYDDEYREKVNQIFDTYYKTDFETFNSKFYELNLEYDIKLDPKPRKDFKDFINTVKEINELYAQVQLDEDKKAEFINEYMELLVLFKDNPIIFDNLLNQLYQKYEIKRDLNSKIPEIFELYREEYRLFFEKELTTFELFHDDSKFMEGEDDPIDHDDDNVEIWTYEGDFDFGEYVYHPEPAPGEITLDVDPDSVATEDYDYNKASIEPLKIPVEIWKEVGDYDFGEFRFEDESDHNTDEVEIWTYEGDFDFGSLEEGIDPDSVATEDYDYDIAAINPIYTDIDPDTLVVDNYDYEYNKAAEYIVLTTYYDIIEKNS